MGKSYTAERSRAKALLRQLPSEVTYVNAEIRRAANLMIWASVNELTRNYEIARQNYAAAIEALSDVGQVISNSQAAYGTLYDIVQEETEKAKEGFRSVKTKTKLAEYIDSTVH